MLIDVIVAWVWIIASALISAVGILLAYKRAGAAAINVYAGGLLLLAATAYRVHPALVRAGLPQEVQELQDELSEARSRLSAGQARLHSAKSRLRDLETSSRATEAELTATRSAASACQKDKEREVAANRDLQLQIEKSAAELETLRNKVSLLSAENKTLAGQLEAVKEEHQSVLQAYQANEALLAGNVQHIHRLETERSSLADALSEKEKQLALALGSIARSKELASNMKAPEPAEGARAEFSLSSSPSLDIKKLENKEVVQGEIGDYYLISLMDTRTGSPLTFMPASFVITDNAAALRSGIEELRQNVLQHIPSNWQYKIFVRGRADGGTFKEPIGDEDYRNLEYLPPSSADGFSYQDRAITKHLDREYENEDLPNLRAAFMARALRETLKGEAPVLLGNNPEPGLNPAERRAEIILFLKKPPE